MPTPGVESRLKGGLWGEVVGDLLGLSFQFKTRDEIEEIFKTPDEVKPLRGLWSDDTSLTLATADALVKTNPTGKNFKEALVAIAENFIRWYRDGDFTPTGYAFDIGNTTREAIKRLMKGIPPTEAGGRGERDNGNGSLMRILPAAYWAYFKMGTLEEKLNFIHSVSSITHAHPRSLLGCGIYSLVVWNILEGNTKGVAVEKSLKEAYDFYSQREEFKEELKHYGRLFDGSLFNLGKEEISTSGYVVHTLEAALWGFLKFNTFERTLKEMVHLGGDADTVGAVVGSLAGTYYGFEAIPPDWLKMVEKRELVEEIIEKFVNTILDFKR